MSEDFTFLDEISRPPDASITPKTGQSLINTNGLGGSGPGRRCRDTFTSLKKTCRKHGVSFWEYLKDRVTGQNVIARLPDLIRSQTL